MLIRFTRSGARNRLTCVRSDGTFTQSDLGPRVPFHDLAHIVAERNLNIREGFFGNIQRGYSIEELSSRETILSLGPDSRTSEVAARAVQGLGSGAYTNEEFVQLIKTELRVYGMEDALTIANEVIDTMKAEYAALIEQWNALRDGETLELEWAQ